MMPYYLMVQSLEKTSSLLRTYLEQTLDHSKGRQPSLAWAYVSQTCQHTYSTSWVGTRTCLSGKLIFVNEVPFFIIYRTAERIKSQRAVTLLAAIKQVKSAYMKSKAAMWHTFFWMVNLKRSVARLQNSGLPPMLYHKTNMSKKSSNIFAQSRHPVYLQHPALQAGATVHHYRNDICQCVPAEQHVSRKWWNINHHEPSQPYCWSQAWLHQALSPQIMYSMYRYTRNTTIQWPHELGEPLLHLILMEMNKADITFLAWPLVNWLNWKQWTPVAHACQSHRMYACSDLR